jgi:hypothetical protein
MKRDVNVTQCFASLQIFMKIRKEMCPSVFHIANAAGNEGNVSLYASDCLITFENND